MIEMVTSGKAVHKSLTLISIDSVKIIAGGAVSIVTFTEDHVFEYEGESLLDLSCLFVSPHVCSRTLSQEH